MRDLGLLLAALLGVAMGQVDESLMKPPTLQMKIPQAVRPRKTFDWLLKLSNPGPDVVYNAGLVANLHPVGIKYLKSWQKKGKTEYVSHPIHRGAQLNFTNVEIPAKGSIMFKIKLAADKCAQEEMFFSAYSYVLLGPPNPRRDRALATSSFLKGPLVRRQVLTRRSKKDPPCAPTPSPTSSPTGAPTKQPTEAPTPRPTKQPTEAPTIAPTRAPTCTPLFLDCPTNTVVTSRIICVVESYCTSVSASCPDNAGYPPAGNLVLNGGFENSSSIATDWIGISPVSPGGVRSDKEWQGSYSLKQGQTQFDSNGYAGGYYQPVDGLTQGGTATVRYALWSDGGTASNICHSAFLGSIQLVADPCTFQNNKWNYLRCDNVPITTNDASLKFLFLQKPTYWWMDGVSVVQNP